MTTSIAELNNLLGQELGRRADGHPIFAWKNSDNLFWPAFQTGRKISKTVELAVPILGGGTQIIQQETVVPEYRRDRQMRAENVWVVTKWLTAEQLIWGWVGKHGEPSPGTRPSQEVLERLWAERFPGADFPNNGWRIPTDASLPRWEGGPRQPNLADTRFFIAQVKEQTRLNFDERLKDMEASEDRKSDATRREIEDAARDCFPALLNPTPGKRSSFVSFPGIAKFLR